jgi:hypothetical protein
MQRTAAHALRRTHWPKQSGSPVVTSRSWIRIGRAPGRWCCAVSQFPRRPSRALQRSRRSRPARRGRFSGSNRVHRQLKFVAHFTIGHSNRIRIRAAMRRAFAQSCARMSGYRASANHAREHSANAVEPNACRAVSRRGSSAVRAMHRDPPAGGGTGRVSSASTHDCSRCATPLVRAEHTRTVATRLIPLGMSKGPRSCHASGCQCTLH